MEDAEPMMKREIHGERPLGRRAAWAWGVFGVTSLLWVVAIVTVWLTRDLKNLESLGNSGADVLVTVATAVVLMMFPIAGVVIATRQPANTIGWILLAIGGGWGLLAGATGYADYGIRLHPDRCPRRTSPRRSPSRCGPRRSGSPGRSCSCSSPTAACPAGGGGGSPGSERLPWRRAW